MPVTAIPGINMKSVSGFLAAMAAFLFVLEPVQVASAVKVTYSGDLATSPLDVKLAGVVEATMAPQVKLAASTQFSVADSSGNLVVLDLHLSAETPGKTRQPLPIVCDA